jgi:hypothetical protein
MFFLPLQMTVALKDRVLAKIAELASTVMTEENINTNLVL